MRWNFGAAEGQVVAGTPDTDDDDHAGFEGIIMLPNGVAHRVGARAHAQDHTLSLAWISSCDQHRCVHAGH